MVLLAIAASLLAGRVWIAPQDIFAGNHLAQMIVTDIRAPRTILALAMGSCAHLAQRMKKGEV